MKKLACTLAFAILAARGLPAQESSPALLVKVEGKPEPLAVTAVKAEARIFGFLAETRMTLTFSNPYDRQFEGELYFPLPEGSTVSGYALDINGRMVDGVIVEKDKGRQVFEEIERQGVDPGLVEWTKGNNFKTRVFPIPAKGSRTVMVRYVSELEDGKYRLPLHFKEKVKDASLRIEVLQAVKEPALSECEFDGFQFARWERGFVAEKKLKNAALGRDLVVEVAEAGKPQVLVEKAPDGTFHFCIADFPDNPLAAKLRAVKRPDRLSILWDASGSRGKGERKKEIEFLKGYLGEPQFEKHKVTVELVLFRNAVAAPQQFTIENGKAEALITALEKVDYDGATQLGCIAPAAKAKPPDFYFLFTDGISNFGADNPAGFKAPVYAFSADAGANAPYLKHLAALTGGEYFNLLREQTFQGIGLEPFSFLSATVDGRDVSEICPGAAEPAGARFVLAGKLLDKETVVTLNYGVGSRVMSKSRFTVRREDAVEGDLLARHWAQKKLQELLVFPKKNDKVTVELGKKYGIVTPGTSLIVLENVQQYVRYRIRPPETQPEWRKEYDAAVARLDDRVQQEEKGKLDHVLALWQARVKWWETEFKYPADFKYAVSELKGAAGEEHEPLRRRDIFKSTESAVERRRVDAAGTAPVQPPPPRPAAAPAEEGREALRRDIFPGPDVEVPLGGTGAVRNMGVGSHKAVARYGGGVAGETNEATINASIAIKPWDPKTPYLEALRQAGGAEAFPVYMEQRKKFGASPAFFLDCADYFYAQKQPELGLQVLSNIAELELENAALLRVLAHRLAQLGNLDMAAWTFEQALDLRPEEPQSWRDLALVLAAQKKYERAMQLLAHVVMNKWARFDEIEVLALMELNDLLRQSGLKNPPVDPRLVKLLDCDVRIVLTWDADLTDIDLHVTEPSGEKAFYSHNRTTIGGAVSRDFTQGYGPEEYIVRKAMPGAYKIQANFYGSQAQQVTGAVTLQVEVFTNYGRPNEKKQSITLRLTEKKETIDVGEVKL